MDKHRYPYRKDQHAAVNQHTLEHPTHTIPPFRFVLPVAYLLALHRKSSKNFISTIANKCRAFLEIEVGQNFSPKSISTRTARRAVRVYARRRRQWMIAHHRHPTKLTGTRFPRAKASCDFLAQLNKRHLP